ncbi:hypothetical protein NEISICOT_00955 [Neisseria sicca ATCC 29256]|uniref:Uncharacterized protein n=1 Tax=Neisseria sicca ATCC 29256 TaxID=547045 RepID=C6M364_NEISI|nr:hypothetical protein NEISICOT_00955 [Neisseria sicca ATCC 29256]
MAVFIFNQEDAGLRLLRFTHAGKPNIITTIERNIYGIMYFAIIATLGCQKRADGMLVQSQNVERDLLENIFRHFLLLSFCGALISFR